MTCVLPNRRYFGSVAVIKVASEALAASHHVHSHQHAKETRSGLDATGSPRLSRRKNCEQIQGPASSQCLLTPAEYIATKQRLQASARAPSAPQLKTFGTGWSASVINHTEQTIFEHFVPSGTI